MQVINTIEIAAVGGGISQPFPFPQPFPMPDPCPYPWPQPIPFPQPAPELPRPVIELH
ncbi:MAG: hypothetical protein ACT4NL_10405 [Pseudomarimonas sp.]